MKLPDFLQHVGLNQLRQQMGAELISWRAGGSWDPIDIELGGIGIEIPLDEIEPAPDGTLEYKGRKVVVYIRDHYVFDSYERVDPDELVDPEQLRKFHVVNCGTLKNMRSKDMFDRYVVTNRKDGRFIVNFLVGGRVHDKGKEVERRLYICMNCLRQLARQSDYRHGNIEWDEMRESFDLKAFFERYDSKITEEPTHTDITAPINEYPPDWDQISRRYKGRVEWRCEDCDIDLRGNKEFLDVHHINRLKFDNEEKNLRALCIGCHAEQHQHIRSNPRYQAFLRWRNQ